jgi:hypothetical protein
MLGKVSATYYATIITANTAADPLDVVVATAR